MKEMNQTFSQEKTMRKSGWIIAYIFLLIKYLTFSEILECSIPWFGLDRAVRSPQNALYIVLALYFLFCYVVIVKRIANLFPQLSLVPILLIVDPFYLMSFCTFRSLLIGALFETIILLYPKLSLKSVVALTYVYSLISVIIDVSAIYSILPLASFAPYLYYTFIVKKSSSSSLLRIMPQSIIIGLVVRIFFEKAFPYFLARVAVKSDFDVVLFPNSKTAHIIVFAIIVVEILFFIFSFRSYSYIAKKNKNVLSLCIILCVLPTIGFFRQIDTLGVSTLTLAFLLLVFVLGQLKNGFIQKFLQSKSIALLLTLILFLSWMTKIFFPYGTLMAVLNNFVY